MLFVYSKYLPGAERTAAELNSARQSGLPRLFNDKRSGFSTCSTLGYRTGKPHFSEVPDKHHSLAGGLSILLL